MHVDLPDDEADAIAADLVPAATKGIGSGPVAGPLKGYISLGTPVVVPLSDAHATQDEQLAAFLQNDRDHDYHLVKLSCTFHADGADPGRRFDKAWVMGKLTQTARSDAAQPIAWSMEPQRSERPVKIAGAQIGADLKLVSFKLGGDETTSSAIFIEALNELQSDPAWEFTRTRADELRGSHRLLLIVRSPKQTPVVASISLTATVAWRQLFITYHAMFADQPSITFTIP